MRTVALCLIAVLAAGCVTTQRLPVEDRSRTYDLAYPAVFNAVVTALAEEGYAVIDAKMDEGIINTDFLVESGFFPLIFGGPTRIKVTGWISDTESGVRVLLTIVLQDADVDPSGNYVSRNLPAEEARSYYTRLFERIESIM